MNELTNTVTKEYIDNLLDNAQTEEHVFWNKVVVSYKLPNNYIIKGTAACEDPSNFNIEQCRIIAREHVYTILYLLESYLLHYIKQQNSFELTNE